MRYEYKYLIPNDLLGKLRSQIRPFARLDDFAAQSNGQYTVRSIYFDTPRFEFFHMKLDHAAHRLKVRLRGYNMADDLGEVFLEIKRKYEAPIAKNRCLITFGQAKELFRPYPKVENILAENAKADNARRFLYQIHSRNMRPVVNIIYEREPYQTEHRDPDNDLRITFDKNLRAVAYPTIDQLFCETGARHIQHNVFILEIKFNHYCPSWIKPILSGLEVVKVPASKYTLCLTQLQQQIRPNAAFDLFGKSRFLSDSHV